MKIVDQIILKFVSLCSKTEKTYKTLNDAYGSEDKYLMAQERLALQKSLEENALRLPVELTDELAKPLEGKLYIIEMLNDDLSPMEYVVELLYGCFDHDEILAVETMINIHKKGSAQVLAGNEKTLKERLIKSIKFKRRKNCRYFSRSET